MTIQTDNRDAEVLAEDGSALGAFDRVVDPFDDKTHAFYPGAGRLQILEQVQHLSQFGSGFLLVLADEGLGKSTLFRELGARIDADGGRPCALSLRQPTALADILAMIARRLSLSIGKTPTASELFSALQDYIEAADGVSGVKILIDNAELLGEDALTGFTRLQAAISDEHQLHIVLFARPGLLDGFDKLRDRGILLHSFELSPLPQDEIAAYLQSRMAAAGYDLELPFSESELDDFFQQSEGVPARLNALARRGVLEQLNPRTESRPQLPLPHLIAAISVALIIVLALLFRSASKEEAASESLAGLAAIEDLGEKVSGKDAGQDQVAMKSDDAMELPKPAVGVEQKTEGPTAELGSAQPEKVLSPSPIADSEPQAEKPAQANIPSASNAKTSPLAKPPSIPRSEPVEPEKTAKKPTPKAAPAAKPADPLSDVIAREEALLTGMTADERWLMARSGQHYSLQVLGASTEEGVAEFISGQELEGLRYYRSRLRGKSWFVVVYGDFADAEAARTVINILPNSMKGAKPFPVSFSKIQEDIRAFGEFGRN